MSDAVIRAASDGHLQQVVIDEAHLVDQWGTDFRPEFQTMPGLIRDAYDKAPEDRKPAVLLLSATLAQRAVDVITRLFKVGDRPVDLVWGSEIRTEPAYFFSKHDSEDARVEAVLKAVKRLPRPLILYTTKVEDAEAWAQRLREAGLARVDAITGKSSDDKRRTVMERWRGEAAGGGVAPTSVDVVVGTSAFGLGLDMPNVRTVLHACLPETIDRYYQEVGRAGRDGRPSVAYLAEAPPDKDLAVSLNTVTMIGDDRGWKRWEAMRLSAEKFPPFRYRILKGTLPAYLDVGYGRHEAWNVRTLTLLAQAGVIDLRAPRMVLDPDLSEDERESKIVEFYNQAQSFVEFELRDGALLEQSAWKAAAAKVRSAVNSAQADAPEVDAPGHRGAVVRRTHDRPALQGAGRPGAPAHERGMPWMPDLSTGPVAEAGREAGRTDAATSAAEPRPGPVGRWLGAGGMDLHPPRAGENLSGAVHPDGRAAPPGLARRPEIVDRLQRDAASMPIIQDDPGSGVSLARLVQRACRRRPGRAGGSVGGVGEDHRGDADLSRRAQ